MYAVLGIVSDTRNKEVKGTLDISWHLPGAMENLFLGLLFLSDNSWGNYLTKRQHLSQLSVLEGKVCDLGTFFSHCLGLWWGRTSQQIIIKRTCSLHGPWNKEKERAGTRPQGPKDQSLRPTSQSPHGFPTATSWGRVGIIQHPNCYMAYNSLLSVTVS